MFIIVEIYILYEVNEQSVKVVDSRGSYLLSVTRNNDVSII